MGIVFNLVIKSKNGGSPLKYSYLKLMREGLIYLKCSINKNKMLYFLNKFHTKITIFMDTYIALTRLFYYNHGETCSF